MAEKSESHTGGSGRNPRGTGVGASKVTARREDSSPECEQMMEAVVERENMLTALHRVMSNRGAAGVDRMTVEELKPYLKEEWKRIKEELLTDEYRPSAVLKVEIPINMKFVEGAKCFAGQKAYSKKEAMDWFNRAATAATKPFIYLSAGVSDEVFRETLELAAEADTPFAGVLCGRATWQAGIPVYAVGKKSVRRRVSLDEAMRHSSPCLA